ncbi:MAG: ATP-grasp domain-containing protein [Gemmataceae bacterium]
MTRTFRHHDERNARHQSVAVVHPYSSAAELAPELRRRQFRCVAVHSEATPDALWHSYRPEDFDEEVWHQKSLQDTAAALRRASVFRVIAGAESGVELADALAAALGLPGNGIEKSAARRDKYLMGETVRLAGLRTPDQAMCLTLEQARGFYKQCGGDVVVKPPRSAGGDCVALPDTEAELEDAFSRIQGQLNVLGLLNDAVLVQRRLRGTEYVVNAVNDKVTDIWKYSKGEANGSPFVYETMELLPADGETQQALANFAAAVRSALGIKLGPSHAEIMLTSQGPALVEIAARMNGGTAPTIAGDVLGQGQIDLTVDAYVDPAALARKTAHPYRLPGRCLVVFLISRREGCLRDVPGMEAVRSLEAFAPQHLHLSMCPGDRVCRTVDLLSSPGWIVFAHEDPDAVEAGHRLVRDLEREGRFFEFE